MKKQHMIVGLSGGVDSSVAAYLLKKAGHHVKAIFMKNWEGDDTETYCQAEYDLADAQAVCDLLKIELQVVNFSDRYWERVFSYFLEEYRAGRTPNPDILCNKEIKFNAFLDYAKQQGADTIATGHYAQTLEDTHGIHLLKGHDPQKDQSYFLYALDQTQLSQSDFPIGQWLKSDVRALAKQLGFTNHAKKDSTGICFIGERKFKTFLSEYLPAQPGKIENIDGETMSEHDGLMFYTIGQRAGLKIGGLKNKSELPWYVVHKDMKRNVLIVAQGESHPALFKQSLIVKELHWIHHEPIFPLQTAAKIRYRQKDQACVVEKKTHEKGMEVQEVAEYRQVIFDQPQRAITPGQSIVFYQEDICLGGGIIAESM